MFRKIIYTNLITSLILTEYNKSRYSLFLTHDATRARISLFYKEKSQVKVEFLKYIENI